ncbi:MAG TPA: hypothetical protein VFU36_06860 [Jatrophihabitans sp.]|nr:hypothetical protein [Jatrophihabitans sp.]
MTASISGVVSCPQPPLLLPGLTGRPVPEVEQLRAACHAAIAGLLAGRPDELVLIGGIAAAERDRPAEQAPPAVRDRPAEPVSLRVGRQLLAEVGCAIPVRPVPIRADATTAECLATGRRLVTGTAGAGERIGLLVLADGSARRGLKAPGYLDPRADPFDRSIERALAAGDPAGLAALEMTVAAELLVAGRAAWQVLAGATEGCRFEAEVHYLGDPFGVWYPVVAWQPVQD